MSREFSNEELVCVAIFDYNQQEKPIHFTKILEIYPQIDNKELGRILNKLFDLCMIDAEWELVEERWVRKLHTSHAYDDFFEALFVAYQKEKK